MTALRERATSGVPTWLLGLGPLLLIVAAIGAFAALGGPGLGERRGPPAEELVVERAVLKPVEFTDTVMLCQGQRGILELCFERPGKFMFHAHQSEFTELGWMGFFDVDPDGPAKPSLLCKVG